MNVKASGVTGRHVARRPKLFVYQKALDAAKNCEAVSRCLVGSRPDLADQLRRASCGVVLNIAEGAAEFSPREKIRFYRMARRSAAESDGVLDLVEHVVEAKLTVVEARRALDEVMALLTVTVKSVEPE